MRALMLSFSLAMLASQAVVCNAQAVGGRGGASPVVSMVFPALPTTDDEILFDLAIDGFTYGNDCDQLVEFGGSDFTIFVDEPGRSIQVGVTGAHPGVCPTIFLPVTGIQGSVGPLAAGDWEIVAEFPGNSSLSAGFGETFSFTVSSVAVPEPAAGVLLFVTALGYSCRRNRPNVVRNKQERRGFVSRVKASFLSS